MPRVTFALSASGRNYFKKFLNKISATDRAIILAVFVDIQSCGMKAKGCNFRQIEGKLWEIKMRTPTSSYRFFYLIMASDEFHILHSYRKQSQKAPNRELEVARKRLKEVSK